MSVLNPQITHASSNSDESTTINYIHVIDTWCSLKTKATPNCVLTKLWMSDVCSAKDMEKEEEEEEVEDGACEKVTTLHDYVRVLRDNAVYRTLFMSYCIDNCGNWFTYVACIGIIERVSVGEVSALDTSLFLICRLLPSVLFAGILGPIADRYDKVTLLIICSSGSALSVFIMLILFPVVVLYGKIPTLILLYTLAVMQFTFSALYEPVRNSLLPIVVSEADLIVATSLDGLAWSTVGAFGAALGGVVNSWFGATTSFGLDVISYLVCTYWLYTVRRQQQQEDEMCLNGGNRSGSRRREQENKNKDKNKEEEKHCSVLGGLVERRGTERQLYREDRVTEDPCALHEETNEDAIKNNTDFVTALVYLYEHKFTLLLCLIKAGGSILWGVAEIIAVKVSLMTPFQSLGDASVTLGLIYACVGVGCQLGPLLWNHCTPQKEKSLLFAVVIAFVQMGISYVLLVYSGSLGRIWGMFAATVLRTMGSSIVWIYSTLLLQRAVSGHMQGRVFAIEQAICVLSEIGSIVLGGIFFDRLEWSVEETCQVMGLVGGCVSLFWVLVYGVRYHWCMRAEGRGDGIDGGLETAYAMVAMAEAEEENSLRL